MGAFASGVTAGRQAGPSGAAGFMGQLLSSIVKVDERRRVEDELRKKEDRALIDTIKKLTAQENLQRETMREREKLGRETIRQEKALRQPMEERKMGLQERTLRQNTIDSAYRRARDIASDYLENPDPDDKTPSITARALAAEAFDNYMGSAGYSDITFLNQFQPDKEEAGIADEEETPETSLFPTALSAQAPASARMGERGGHLVRKGLEALGKLPSQAVGLGSTAYNVLAGGVAGATGIPQHTVPQPALDVMRRGELFDVPEAIKFYRDLFKKKPKAEIRKELGGE